jgi:hypothetical protein
MIKNLQKKQEEIMSKIMIKNLSKKSKILKIKEKRGMMLWER